MDPAVLTITLGVLVAAGLVAALIPARYAARVEPLVALRGE
jgi:ABC-type antimicrobial peptide transport system permease subunit